MCQAEDYLNPRCKAYRGHCGRPVGKILGGFMLVLPGLLLVTQGCLNRVHDPLMGPQGERPIRPRLASFGQPLVPITPDVVAADVTAVSGRTTRYRKFEISAPSITDNGQDDRRIHATLFETTTPTPRPLVVVFPIWGVSTYPPRQIVRRLTRGPVDRQVNVLWIRGDQRLFDWDAIHHANTEADIAAILDRWTAAAAGTVIDIRRLIAWAHERPAVAQRPTTVVGFSIGAIVAALVAGTENHVHGGVLVFGGGHIDQIITTCGGKARRFRNTARERTNISPARLARMLKERLDPIDPVHYAGAIDPRTFLVIDAGNDGCISAAGREDLWRALGRPERVTVGYNHRRAFLTMTPLGFHFTTRAIISYLERTALRAHPPPRGGPLRGERAQTSAGGPDRFP